MMSGLFYNLGRRLGHAVVPAIRKGRWVWNGLTGTEAEALRAEQSLGAALATELRSATAPPRDPSASVLIQELGQRLAKGLPNERRKFHCEVIQSEFPNGIALPGGYVFVSESLVELCERRPDELAFVVGHEMAHILLGHAWDRMVDQSALRAASVILARAGPLGPWFRQHGLQLLRSAHTRQCEVEADAMGCRLSGQAGYDPAGAVRMLRRVQQLGSDPSGLGQYFASHPPAEERISRLEAAS